MNDGFIGLLRLVSVAIQNAGFAVVVGALLGRHWLAHGASAWQHGIGRRLVGTLRIASVVSLAASITAFWAHCALMSEVSLLEAGPAVCSMLAGTGFGHAWLAGAVFMLIVVVLSFVRRASDALPFAMWAALACVALARSNGGHPVDAGLFSVPVWIDWLHLLAISAWVGRARDGFRRDAEACSDARKRTHDRRIVRAIAVRCVDLRIDRAVRDRRVQRLARRRYARQSARIDVRADPAAEARARADRGGARRTQPLLRDAHVAGHVEGSGRVDAGQFVETIRLVLRIEAVVLGGVLMVAAVLVSSALPGTV